MSVKHIAGTDPQRSLCGRSIAAGWVLKSQVDTCKTCAKINAKTPCDRGSVAVQETSSRQCPWPSGIHKFKNGRCERCGDAAPAPCVECNRVGCAGHDVWDLASIAAQADEAGTVTVELGRYDRAPAPGTTKKHFKGGTVTYVFHRDGGVDVIRTEGTVLVYSPLPTPTMTASAPVAVDLVAEEVAGTVTVAPVAPIAVGDRVIAYPWGAVATVKDITPEGHPVVTVFGRTMPVAATTVSPVATGRYRVEATRAGGDWLPSATVAPSDDRTLMISRTAVLRNMVPDSRFRVVDTTTGTVIHEQLHTEAELGHAAPSGLRRFACKYKRHGRAHR